MFTKSLFPLSSLLFQIVKSCWESLHFIYFDVTKVPGTPLLPIECFLSILLAWCYGQEPDWSTTVLIWGISVGVGPYLAVL